MKIAHSSHVLVPLCGKTMDLLWLANQNYNVIGVELSSIACEAFFIENKLSFNKKIVGNFTCYYNDNIKLYCGDFFELSSYILPPISAVYDRAALIALPDEMRPRYVSHLTQLMALGSQIFLIVYDSADTIKGPPYPISFNEVKKLFKDQFQISELARLQKTDILNHLREKGYHSAYEVVYSLKK
jgi:thiopurine S-methyltransferase